MIGGEKRVVTGSGKGKWVGGGRRDGTDSAWVRGLS